MWISWVFDLGHQDLLMATDFEKTFSDSTLEPVMYISEALGCSNAGDYGMMTPIIVGMYTFGNGSQSYPAESG